MRSRRGRFRRPYGSCSGAQPWPAAATSRGRHKWCVFNTLMGYYRDYTSRIIYIYIIYIYILHNILGTYNFMLNLDNYLEFGGWG